MNAPMRVVVVDDEPLARDGLSRIVSRLGWCEVVGQCGNAATATRMGAELRPDVLLLDVEMPGDDGFAVLRALPSTEQPFTILVTAFEQYALPAFEASVRGYVLKPVDTHRLVAALGKARDAVHERRLARLGTELRALSVDDQRPRRGEKLVIRDAGRLRVVALERVEWIEADGYHARIHEEARNYLMRESLDSLARRLPPAFVRAHRSAIVNLEYVVELKSRRDGSFVAILRHGTQLEVSRRRIAALRAALRSRV